MNETTLTAVKNAEKAQATVTRLSAKLKHTLLYGTDVEAKLDRIAWDEAKVIADATTKAACIALNKK